MASGIRIAITLIASTVAVACSSSSSSSSSPNLYQTWQSDTASGGYGVTFNHDGTYEFQTLLITGSNSMEDSIEGGGFSMSGSTITFQPQESSCSNDSTATYTMNYSLSQNALTLTSTAGAISFVPDTTSPGSVAGGFQLTTGCFGTNGTFTPSPVAKLP